MYLYTLFGQPVYLERDDLFVLDSLARVEGEGHILGVTRWDDLGLEVMMEMCSRGVQTVHAEETFKFHFRNRKQNAPESVNLGSFEILLSVPEGATRSTRRPSNKRPFWFLEVCWLVWLSFERDI